MIRSHRDLIAWQVARELAREICVATRAWPKEELYALSAQIRRAAVSVPSNIAEGNGRESTQEYLRFLSIAYGSLMEVDTQVAIAQDLGYLNETQLKVFERLIERVGQLLNALKRSLKQCKQKDEARS